MRYALEPIDSQVLGQRVVSLHCDDGMVDIDAAEAGYVRDHDPAYVSCKVPLREVALLHSLQRHGFLLMECQLQTIGEPHQAFDTSGYSYHYEQVGTADALEDVLAIASSVIRYDRFSVDPEIPKWFSGARYEAYVRQSVESEDEEVWQLCEFKTGKAVAFRTFRRLPDGGVRLLLEGVSALRPSMGVGTIETQFFLAEMYRRQVPSLEAFVSATDLAGFTIDITGFGFRLSQAFAVLRKLYKPIT
jgi:hypothetical protein